MVFWTSFIAMYIGGVLSAGHALFHERNKQSSLLWLVALTLMPCISLPVYWMFGRSRLGGYLARRKQMREDTSATTEAVTELLAPHAKLDGDVFRFARDINSFTPTGGNRVEIYHDTVDAFNAILEALGRARKYVLVQFYEVQNDEAGTTLLRKLRELGERGVRVYFYFDPLHSTLQEEQVSELERSGAVVAQHTPGSAGFDPASGNFRNHRKLVIVDGLFALSGGMNIGDFYLSRVEEYAPWNDLFSKIKGPSVLNLQVAFYQDFYFTTSQRIELDWEVSERVTGDANVAVFATDPDDVWDICGLAYVEAIGLAEERIILASPFFIPDEKGLYAIQAALLRGVRVQILRPNKTKVSAADYAAWAYIEELLPHGVEFYRQPDGAMHKKVLLIDDKFVMFGSANFDYRSFHLNHELFLWIDDESVIHEVKKELLGDLERFHQITVQDLKDRSLAHRVLTKACSLLTPVL